MTERRRTHSQPRVDLPPDAQTAEFVSAWGFETPDPTLSPTGDPKSVGRKRRNAEQIAIFFASFGRISK